MKPLKERLNYEAIGRTREKLMARIILVIISIEFGFISYEISS